MSDLITLDYETYYAQDYTLRPNKLCNMNTSEYIRDERFKAHMVGVKINAEKTFVLPHEDIKKFLKGINWKKTELLAHNTAFDGLICSHHYGAVPYVYRDTLSMARALHSNEIGASLDEVAKLYGVGNKMQDVLDQSKGIRDLHSVPGLYDTMAAYCAVDVDLCWAIYMMMTQRDKFPEHELELIHLTLQCFCDPVLRVDVPRVRKLHQAEITRKQDILEKVTGSRDLAEAKLFLGKDTWLAAELQARGIEPPMKYSVKKSASKGEDVFNYAFAKGDEAFLDLLEHEDEEVRLLVEARLEVKSALNETRALRMLNAAAKPHWRLPVGYSYYGAVTGRWSGANKFNMQNLPRGGELRKCILAPVGHHIITGDSSQIEARVLAYITGNERLLDVFRSGADPYSFQATEMYGHEVVKDRSPQDDEERQIGKVAMLALGYQGGSGAFTSMAKNYGVRLPDSQVKQIVNKFRRANPEYVKFWAVCEKVIEGMYHGRSGTFGTGDVLHYEGKRGHNGRIRLPNGMYLKYPDIQVEHDELGRPQYSYRVKNGRKKLYSGLLCLSGDTEVLTNNGWKRLTDVTPYDYVFDGLEWVHHEGLTFNGIKQTMDFGGVRMTPDHLVLTSSGWQKAKDTTHAQATSQSSKYNWAAVRFSDGTSAFSLGWKEYLVAHVMHLRNRKNPQRLGVAPRPRTVMRVSDHKHAISESNETRDDSSPTVRGMAQYGRALYLSLAQSMEKLWCTGNNSLQRVEAFVQRICGRHATHVYAQPYAGSNRQQQGLLSRKLSLGSVEHTSKQPTQYKLCENAKRGDAGSRSGTCVRSEAHHAAIPDGPQLAAREAIHTGGRNEPVYDLINAGPRRRFTVRGADGKPFIVHNCENIIQALARIVVADQIATISRRLRLTMTTHDEGSWLARSAIARKEAAWVKEQMSVPPAWALDLPVGSDVKHAAYYCK